MGSPEEEKLLQMVNDFIESSESSQPIFCSSSESLPFTDEHPKYYILKEILEYGTAAEIGVLECVLKHMRNKMEEEKTSSLKKWLVKNLRKDGFNASLCHTSWDTTFWCPGGDYVYIDITFEEKSCSALRRMIVDIDFKSQFELARPTSSYKMLSDTLPTIFVGDERKLDKIISILCSEAKHSLRERGLHIPPWRTSTYMRSKWFCDHPQKVPSSPAAAARETKEDKFCSFLSSKFNKWAPPTKRKSALSSQFSNMSTECF